MSNIALWYTARGTGVISLVLLTLVVALGIASRSGRAAFGLPRFAVAAGASQRRACSRSSLLGIHVTTLMLDSTRRSHVTDLLVPFVGSYRPFWQGLGTLALRADPRAGRRPACCVTACPSGSGAACTGSLTPAWPVAFAHGLGTGTDRGTVWMRGITRSLRSPSSAAVGWRLAPHFAEHSRVRRPLARPTIAPALGKDPMTRATLETLTTPKIWPLVPVRIGC